MKVAIVCDWLIGIGGAERVVLEMHKQFPTAPIYTSQYNPAAIDWLSSDADVRTTWLQKLPLKLRKFLPLLRAWSFSHLDLSDYDLVLSSSGAEAKSVKIGPNTLHICYCHAPTHYYWSRYDQYMEHPGVGLLNPLARLGLRVLVGPMRHWDKRAAQKPSYIITNSNFSRLEINKYYGREATVIHPPVDTERFKNTKGINRKGFLIAGRQTPYKRFDLAVDAATELNLPLTVIGDGPEHEKLRKTAGESVVFVNKVSDNDMPAYFQRAKAFIFPGIDDFGIVAIEAMAAGTPVIAFRGGGALDYVIPNKTGVFFSESSVKSLVETIAEFEAMTFSSEDIAIAARSYSVLIFQEKLKSFINSCINPSR